MSPCSRSPRRPARLRHVGAIVAAILVGLSLMAAPVGASTRRAPRAVHTGPATNSLTLLSQSSWVAPGGTLTLSVKVSSPLPASSLGLQVLAYSKLGTRNAFDNSLQGNESSQSLLPGPYLNKVIRLAPIVRPGGMVTLTFNVVSHPVASTTSPTIPLSACTGSACDGVYPLEVSLVDTAAANRKLASFTTDLVYATHRGGAVPLRVALVLPLGTGPSISPENRSTLSQSQLGSLGRVIGVLSANPDLPLTLDLHGQLLAALSRPMTIAATAVKLALSVVIKRGTTNGHLELLNSTFVPVDLESLAGAGLDGELQTQLVRNAAAIESALHVRVGSSPFVAGDAFNTAALGLLEKDGFREVVLPKASLSLSTQLVTPDSPFVVTSTPATTTNPASLKPADQSSSVTGLENDPILASRMTNPSSDSVLLAHQMLAELSQIYFESPFAAQARGVVVAPQSWQPDAAFLGPLLRGLATSPILAASDLSGLFQNLMIGANGQPAGFGIVGENGNSGAGGLSKSAIARARATVDTTAAVYGGSGGVTRYYDAILLAESAGISDRARQRYLAAAAGSLSSIGHALSFPGARRVTLTSLTGKVPITVKSGLTKPINVVLELKSSKLTFRKAKQVWLISPKDNPLSLVVSTRTSGEFVMTVELVAPQSGAVLGRADYTVQSTAVTGVALALSLGALAVLLAWWIRSFARHRRRLARERAPAGEAPTQPI